MRTTRRAFLQRAVLLGLTGDALGTFVTSCARPSRHLHVVTILDLTASVTLDGSNDMLASVESMFRVLDRGDSVTVIPVTGDEQAQASGHISRFELPAAEKRESYDQDLRRLINDAHSKLEHLKSLALKRAYVHSDILGAFDLAAEELTSAPDDFQLLISLSDYVQDDARYKFKRDEAVANRVAANHLADRLARDNRHRFRSGTPIYIGLLPSSDFATLSRERREAVEDFWIDYLTLLGGKPQFVVDGPGLLPTFLKFQGRQR